MAIKRIKKSVFIGRSSEQERLVHSFIFLLVPYLVLVGISFSRKYLKDKPERKCSQLVLISLGPDLCTRFAQVLFQSNAILENI